jgi:hypothetical protein
MMPWVISHDLICANVEQTARNARYAHHRVHLCRRPGRRLASLLRAWSSPIRRYRAVVTPPRTCPAVDTLNLRVVPADEYSA